MVSLQLSLFTHNRSPGIPARPPFCPHNVTTLRSDARRWAIPWSDNHSVKGNLGILTELVLGGPRVVRFGRARLPPSRAPPTPTFGPLESHCCNAVISPSLPRSLSDRTRPRDLTCPRNLACPKGKHSDCSAPSNFLWIPGFPACVTAEQTREF
jgi:hypothetical protein